MLRLPHLLLPLLLLSSCHAGSDKFWAIAHMANTEGALGWSLAAGANALEIDVTFDSTGQPKTTYHGTPCDCSCFISYGICMFPIGEVCTRTRPVTAILGYLMAHELRPQVALLYLDSKVGAVGPEMYPTAARNMVLLIRDQLVRAGYTGYVLVGGPNGDYLEAVAAEARNEGIEDQLLVTFDMYSRFSEQVQFLATLDHPRTVISAGITACLQAFRNFESEATLGRLNQARGVVSETIVWTIDGVSDWDRYYNRGARGMITNAVPELVRWARERGYELYTLADVIPPHNSTATPVYQRGSCDCELQTGSGCTISNPAPALSACTCTLSTMKNQTSCVGRVTGCLDNDSPHCASPDTTYESCVQGAGECTGYQGHPGCTCAYNGNGCEVTSGAVGAGEACRCIREGGKCDGEVVRCGDVSSPHCAPSSTTLLSCLQGGGDCAGYTDNCQCEKQGGGGCRVTAPSPASTACHCRRYSSECRGHSVLCADESDPLCQAPDTSLTACLLGAGNCSGYGESCTCKNYGSGCRVTKAPPSGTACRCRREKGWFSSSCYGEIVGCSQPSSDKCTNPDTTRETCHQGLGNCAGY